MLKRIIRRLRYELLDAPRGRGRGSTQEVWDAQFARGDWKHLYSIEELSHYMVVLGHVIHYAPEPASLLDAGCGQGRLLEVLRRANFAHYLGTDISATAIEQAAALKIPNTEFKVCSFEDWSPETQFDLIIFNESLGYAADPRAVLKAFTRGLKPGGKFIVSLHHFGNHRSIWRNLDREFTVMAADLIENVRGQRWTIKTLAPRA